jgi:hypothetical protein
MMCVDLSSHAQYFGLRAGLNKSVMYGYNGMDYIGYSQVVTSYKSKYNNIIRIHAGAIAE